MPVMGGRTAPQRPRHDSQAVCSPESDATLMNMRRDSCYCLLAGDSEICDSDEMGDNVTPVVARRTGELL